MGRLARDARGNTLALMAAFLIPACGLAGSAIDMARLYVVKVRLQQACDAGALAGRKFMATAGTTLDAAANTQAESFFTNNFRTGWMGTTGVTKTFTKTTDSQVAGSASATVPMTIMKMFGQADVTLPVTCEARYDVADTDVMFVLDTTGSMACATADSDSDCSSYAVQNVVINADGTRSVTEKSNSRIAGLRAAVLNFYDQVTTSADPSTNFRFGFVPYSGTVNVGKLLPRNYLTTTNWTYQTRWQLPTDVASGSAVRPAATTTTNADCTALRVRNPVSGYLAADWSYTDTTTVWTKGSGSNGSCQKNTQKYIAQFRYEARSINVADYADGDTVVTPTMPTMPPGVTQPTSTWAGCIEERLTSPSASFSATSPPLDLNVDRAPDATEDTKWKPLWPEVSFSRVNATSEDSTAMRTIDSRYQFNSAGQNIAYQYNELPCPKQAQRLGPQVKTATATVRANINTYLTTNFRPYGVTYHDVGMTWGTRLIAPSGIFAADTAAWPNRNAPTRYIIFLTDGDMQPDAYAYSSHGIEQFDKRVTGSSIAQLENYHNARFATACQIAKDRNIKVFVIGYAQTLTPQLTACASPGSAYYASNTAALNTAFQQIAARIAMLRISQ